MSSLELVPPGKPTPAGLAIVKISTEIPLKIKNRTIKDPAVLAIVTQKYVDNLPQWEFHQQSAGPTLTDTEGHGQIHPLKITPVGLRTCHAVPGGHR